MTDIVDWLRSYEASRIAKQTSEAADTIEALRAENAALKAENWEYVARSYALINMLPDKTMAGEIQDARRVFGGIVEALRAENARLRDLLDNALGWLDDKEHDKPLLSVDNIRAAAALKEKRDD